jgi:GNAT superfamily N-acetyltransferase
MNGEIHQPKPEPKSVARPFDDRHLILPPAGPVLIRAARTDDDPLFKEFLQNVTAEDLRLRFFGAVDALDAEFIARLTHPDRRCLALLVAVEQQTGHILGVARLHQTDIAASGEYAVLVRSTLKGHGLGWILMQLIIEQARAAGLSAMEGYVLAENSRMLQMCGELGFQIEKAADDPGLRIVRLTI